MFGTSVSTDLVSGLSPQDRAELRRLWFEAGPVWSLEQGHRNAEAMDAWLGALRPDDWHDIRMSRQQDTSAILGANGCK